MANTKISALTEATSVLSTDVLPIVSGGATKKVAVSTVVSQVAPYWVKATMGYADFSDATNTHTVTAYTATSDVAILGLSIKTTEAFVGVTGPIISAVADSYWSSNQLGTGTTMEDLTATGWSDQDSGNFAVTLGTVPSILPSGQTIDVTVTADALQVLSNLSAGSFDLYILVSKMP